MRAILAARRTPDSPTPDSYTWIDIHSHHIWSSVEDMMDLWADDLVSFMERHDIHKAVISGIHKLDKPDDEFAHDDAVLRAFEAHGGEAEDNPFIPFVRGFKLEDEASVDYVRDALERGFRGIGELFVHGHNDDVEDLSVLYDIAELALKYDVPLLVHWDVGEVDDRANREVNRERNLDELLAFLEAHSNLVVILAHCGAGPGPDSGRDLDWYRDEVLPQLLARANLSLDLAGMAPPMDPGGGLVYESSSSTPLFTELGEVMLEAIAVSPTRFLVGFDIEDDTVEDPSSRWDQAMRYYEAFLGHLRDDTRMMLMCSNAERILSP
jgi:predicted TIM-barrel fold metal-dependent hydrolase